MRYIKVAFPPFFPFCEALFEYFTRNLLIMWEAKEFCNIYTFFTPFTFSTHASPTVAFFVLACVCQAVQGEAWWLGDGEWVGGCYIFRWRLDYNKLDFYFFNLQVFIFNIFLYMLKHATKYLKSIVFYTQKGEMYDSRGF